MEISGYLFYGSLIGFVISIFLAPLFLPALVISILLIFGVGMFIGFIFAIIGLRKIKEARVDRNIRLRGSGLAISVIVIYGLVASIFAIYITALALWVLSAF